MGPSRRATTVMQKYRVTDKLGTGAFGDVVKAVNTETGDVVRP